jgi:hypothetical protein
MSFRHHIKDSVFFRLKVSESLVLGGEMADELRCKRCPVRNGDALPIGCLMVDNQSLTIHALSILRVR